MFILLRLVSLEITCNDEKAAARGGRLESTPVQGADSREVQMEDVDWEEELERTQPRRTECKVPNKILTFTRALSSAPLGTRA